MLTAPLALFEFLAERVFVVVALHDRGMVFIFMSRLPRYMITVMDLCGFCVYREHVSL